MTYSDDQKEKLIDTIAHLYLRHKRLSDHLELLAMIVETDSTYDTVKITELVDQYDKVYNEIGIKLRLIQSLLESDKGLDR